MKVYTAHIHTRRPPVLVREAFSWGALFFGPLWLFRHAAWIPGALACVILLLICTLAPPPWRPALAFTVVLLLGLFGNDLRRWSLGLRRFQLAHVVAARDTEEAFLRLHAHRPDLLGLSA